MLPPTSGIVTSTDLTRPSTYACLTRCTVSGLSRRDPKSPHRGDGLRVTQALLARNEIGSNDFIGD